MYQLPLMATKVRDVFITVKLTEEPPSIEPDALIIVTGKPLFNLTVISMPSITLGSGKVTVMGVPVLQMTI
jgi:hypothetical protein